LNFIFFSGRAELNSPRPPSTLSIDASANIVIIVIRQPPVEPLNRCCCHYMLIALNESQLSPAKPA